MNKQKPKIVYDLKTNDSGVGDIRIQFDGWELLIDYEYQADDHCIGHIRFSHVVAFRFRNETHSLGFVDGSYDALVEVEDSGWLRELRQIEPPSIDDLTDHHHYAVLLSSNGYLEVIGASFKVEDADHGRLG